MSYIAHFEDIVSGQQDTSLIREYLTYTKGKHNCGRGGTKSMDSRSDTEVVILAFANIYRIDNEFKAYLDSKFDDSYDVREKLFLLYTKEDKNCPYGTPKTYWPHFYRLSCSKSCKCFNESSSNATNRLFEGKNWICESSIDSMSLSDIVADKDTFVEYCGNKSFEEIIAELNISKPLLTYYSNKYGINLNV